MVKINGMCKLASMFREKIEELENQLDHTKTQAHYLLMTQNSEITTTLVGLGQVGEVLSTLQGTLHSQLQTWQDIIQVCYYCLSVVRIT